MRIRHPEIDAYYAAGGTPNMRQGVWLRGKRRDTGALEYLGVWSGSDTVALTVNGAARAYIGLGHFLDVPNVVTEAGLDLRQYRIGLTPLVDAVRDAVALYHLHDQPLEIHTFHFSAETNNLIGAPERDFKGRIIEVEIEEGAEASMEIIFQTGMAALHKPLGLKKSASALRESSETDSFRDNITITDKVEVAWGEIIRGQAVAGVAPKAAPVQREAGEGGR